MAHAIVTVESIIDVAKAATKDFDYLHRVTIENRINEIEAGLAAFKMINPNSEMLAPVFFTIRAMEDFHTKTGSQDILQQRAELLRNADFSQLKKCNPAIQYTKFQEQLVIISGLHQHLRRLSEGIPRLWFWLDQLLPTWDKELRTHRYAPHIFETSHCTYLHRDPNDFGDVLHQYDVNRDSLESLEKLLHRQRWSLVTLPFELSTSSTAWEKASTDITKKLSGMKLEMDWVWEACVVCESQLMNM
ncbi:MAG: hypothetical protein Q9199_001708 [Rusavskia elegans]